MNDEKKQKDIIDELIKKVDDPVCGWKPLSIWKKLQFRLVKIIISVGVIVLMLYIYYALLLLLPFVKTPDVLLPIAISGITLLLMFYEFILKLTEEKSREEIKRVTINWNYEKIKKRVDNEHWLLLKALIHMRTLQQDFKLSEVRREYPSLFIEENLVGVMLYNLSPLSFSTSNSKKSI